MMFMEHFSKVVLQSAAHCNACRHTVGCLYLHVTLKVSPSPMEAEVQRLLQRKPVRKITQLKSVLELQCLM